MGRSRRDFLAQSSMGLIGAVMAGESERAAAEQVPQTPATPGAPPAFGTAAPVGPEVSSATFIEAEKLVQFPLTDSERTMARNSSLRNIMRMRLRSSAFIRAKPKRRAAKALIDARGIGVDAVGRRVEARQRECQRDDERAWHNQ